VFSDSEQDSDDKGEDAHQEELRKENERRKQEFLGRRRSDGHREMGTKRQAFGERDATIIGVRGTINGLLVQHCAFPFSVSAFGGSVVS
jgi:hypothetical protein